MFASASISTGCPGGRRLELRGRGFARWARVLFAWPEGVLDGSGAVPRRWEDRNRALTSGVEEAEAGGVRSVWEHVATRTFRLPGGRATTEAHRGACARAAGSGTVVARVTWPLRLCC